MSKVLDFLKGLVFLKPLVGRRTQLLVALALVLNAFGYVTDVNGVDLSRVDSKLIVQELLIAAFGTTASKFDRILKGVLA